MRLAGCLALTATLAAPATARPPEASTGTLIPGRSTVAPVYNAGNPYRYVGSAEMIDQTAEAAMATGRAMARCLVNREEKRVMAALETNDGDPASNSHFVRLQPQLTSCLGKSVEGMGSQVAVNLSRATLRGLLSEAWLRKHAPPVMAEQAFDDAAQARAIRTGNPSRDIVSAMADCLVFTAPAESVQLVTSDPASPAEKVAITALVPSLSSCVPKKVTLKTNRTGIRLALASALYRRTVVAPKAETAMLNGSN
ncbi:hypothetical protein ABC347_05095 [Sphingomonas sp. 1P06PA]|uniref:hypothetical protein n=1 Tax=Sphingomonas sp. 1P06PA TaxID=554121 RepID=UPI0039A691D2